MAERTELTVLNHLVETCRDGEHGFRFAAEHAVDDEVRDLFTTLADERARFVDELLPHVRRLGGQGVEAGTTAGAIHRGWMTIKTTLTGHHDAVLLAEAERGERHAVLAYADALRGMLPPTVSDLVEQQQNALRDAYARIIAIDRAYNVGT